MVDPLASESVVPQRPDEVYIVFDFNDPSSASADITVSYGEYVQPTRRLYDVRRVSSSSTAACSSRKHPLKSFGVNGFASQGTQRSRASP